LFGRPPAPSKTTLALAPSVERLVMEVKPFSKTFGKTASLSDWCYKMSKLPFTIFSFVPFPFFHFLLFFSEMLCTEWKNIWRGPTTILSFHRMKSRAPLETIHISSVSGPATACRCAVEQLPASAGAAAASRCGRRRLAGAEQWGPAEAAGRRLAEQRRAAGACPRIAGKLRRSSGCVLPLVPRPPSGAASSHRPSCAAASSLQQGFFTGGNRGYRWVRLPSGSNRS
jgi:hypothetical protein